MNHSHLLIDILRNPSSIERLSMKQWDLLIRQARAASLLASLGLLLQQRGLSAIIPQKAALHLDSAIRLVERQINAVHWELSLLEQALYPLAVPVILLKGAAYIAADLPLSHGRLFHDIDILVPSGALDEVEQTLKMEGWQTSHTNRYDQRYYRKWMHELPPMVHWKRRTILDIHHSILPLTARIHPDPNKLFEHAVNSPDYTDFYWLDERDMLLHSATHLFHDGELNNGLRDLLDLDSLMRHFGRRPGFWEGLWGRAEELELTRPLYYALRFTELMLDTPIPEAVKKQVRAASPGKAASRGMDYLLQRALPPDHPSCNMPSSSVSRWLLYLRAHYLRMPMRLLIPHLVHKAIIKEHEADAQAERLIQQIEPASGSGPRLV